MAASVPTAPQHPVLPIAPPPSCTLTQRAVRSRGQGKRAGREDRLGTHTRLCLPFCPQGGGQLPRHPGTPGPHSRLFRQGLLELVTSRLFP